MSATITERELDKMEVEAEAIVSKLEEDFEDAFLGKRKGRKHGVHTAREQTRITNDRSTGRTGPGQAALPTATIRDTAPRQTY